MAAARHADDVSDYQSPHGWTLQVGYKATTNHTGGHLRNSNSHFLASRRGFSASTKVGGRHEVEASIASLWEHPTSLPKETSPF